MASGLSDYFEDQVLGKLFGNQTLTVPATYYIGLWTATLSDSSTGSTAGEPSGNAYARVSVTNNGSNWDAVSGGATANTNLIAFPMVGNDHVRRHLRRIDRRKHDRVREPKLVRFRRAVRHRAVPAR
jgi:coenzyme F420-reducing hydrogenase beta subunit